MLMPLKLCISLVFLATAIDGNRKDRLHQLRVRLTEMTISNGSECSTIDGLFKLVKDGFIERGGLSVIFKGERLSDNLTVAMKFVLDEYRNTTEREFQIFTYLNAINRTDIERFGFPAVYYYNDWNGYILTVISYFDGGDLVDRRNKGFFQNPSSESESIDSLILFRNFVLQSKYMHSRGVRHDDIKPENIMLRKYRSYLIDFNMSSKLKESSNSGSIDYTARTLHSRKTRSATDDWESFLYSMCRLNEVPLEWFDEKILDGIDSKDYIEVYGTLKYKTNDTIKAINTTIESEPLRTVFLEFAEEIFRENAYPDYNRLYDFINTEIEKVVTPPKVPLFTWLKPDEIDEALIELTQNPSPDIKDIDEPSEIQEFQYMNVNYTFFHSQKRSASASESKEPSPRHKRKRSS